jgi:hypothetical protein
MRTSVHSIVLAAACLAVLAPGCVPKPHAYVAEPRTGMLRVAILPLANYSTTRDAPERVTPMLAVELGRQPGVMVADAGAVEAALAREPWLMTDRVPPDLVEKIGRELNADALLVGSIMSYTSRDVDGEAIPQLSLSLRLLEVPSARVLWTAVHSRDGADGEWLFGMGRVATPEQLAVVTMREMMGTFPEAAPDGGLAGKAE